MHRGDQAGPGSRAQASTHGGYRMAQAPTGLALARGARSVQDALHPTKEVEGRHTRRRPPPDAGRFNRPRA
eukprot:scaffold23391_cov129-Isochrysis_galbana.AAC.2